MKTFVASNAYVSAAHELIPGGAHTYAKGDDQYPEGMAPVIERGAGCRVWDIDGNEYVEFGRGLRSCAPPMIRRPSGRPSMRSLI
jgi:glutamate-1-semialdehyde 2,1-aminomutase